MFKKAIPYDDKVIFYFDWFDNKHVAKGGGLAWRLNNPDLIHSRSGVEIVGKMGQSLGDSGNRISSCRPRTERITG